MYRDDDIYNVHRDAKSMNRLSFVLWFNKLRDIVINSFEWIGLDQIDQKNFLTSRIIEKTLFSYGYGCFTTLENNLTFLPAAVSGELNMYFEPTKYNLFGNYIELATVTTENSVLVRNSVYNIPSVDIVGYYAHKLSKIQRAQDVNLEQAKFQIMIETNSDNEYSVKNILKSVEDNDIAILGKKGITEGINSPDLKYNYYIDKFSAYKVEIFNEFLQQFGFENIGVEKNERLTSKEANSSQEITLDGYAGAMLEMRKEACERCKKILGVEIDVKYRRTNSEMMMDREKELNQNNGGEPNNV